MPSALTAPASVALTDVEFEPQGLQTGALASVFTIPSLLLRNFASEPLGN